MANEEGNRHNVTNRWGCGEKDGKKDYGRHQGQRAPFKGEPQYTFDEVFITPFTHALTADGMGRTGYTPLERNLTPTGIHIFDAYLQALHRGDTDIAAFCRLYNARTYDLDGLVFLLTGMSNQVFRNRWIVRTADLLLRYTDIGVVEIARRCGAGTRTNLYFIYERDLNVSPSARRRQLRKPGDLGKYKTVEDK